MSAAADRPDDEVRQADRRVEVAVVGHVEARQTDGRFGDARDVLPTRDEERSECVGHVSLHTD